MLSGDNGILQKATEAKTRTERQSIVEQARTDVLGYQAENKGTDLKKSQLQTVLEKYFKDVPDLTDMQDSDILSTKLDTLAEYGNHNVEVKEIFNGNLLGDNQTKTATSDEINAKIGTVVTGYDAQNLDWQVFYADTNETFLISKKTVKNDWTIPLKGEGKDADYSGSDDVKITSYGSKWNSKWLEKCTSNVSANNAKATAYLCDPLNWESYKVSPATYAVGGPTIELLVASINQVYKQNKNIPDVDNEGYDYNAGENISISNELYSSDESESYFLASPSNMKHIVGTGENPIIYGGYSLLAVAWGGVYGDDDCGYESKLGVRPIVSVPTSKISIDGDTVTVIP